MKKKLIALLLSCAMLTGILSGVASFANENGEIETVDDNSYTATIDGDEAEDNNSGNDIINNEGNGEQVDGTIVDLDNASADPTTATTSEPDASSDDDTDGEDDGEEDYEPEVEILDPIVISEPDEIVESEVGYDEEEIIDFDEVAPYLEPVVGASPSIYKSPALFTASNQSEDTDHLTKTKEVTLNEDGETYTITIEAYAKGAQNTTTVEKEIPTDFILVLDQSGSMKSDIGQVTYEPYKDETGWGGNVSEYHTRNRDYYEYRHNGGSGNLWHKLEDDTYVSVSVIKQEVLSYSATNDNNRNLYSKQANLYAKVNGKYTKVSVERTENLVYNTYTYTLLDGTEIGERIGDRNTPTITGTDDNKLYIASIDDAQTVYTYKYTDLEGKEQTIGSSTGAATFFDKTLYERVVDTSGGGSRIDALKKAVTNFANTVSTKAKGKDGVSGNDDDVNHRIAMVGFANGDSYYGNNYNYENTELFIGSNSYRYGNNAKNQYSNAFQDMNTEDGVNKINASIGELGANGGTLTNLGIEMANGIFENNPLEANEKRNRVVIVFTDGTPGWSGYETKIANGAINEANIAKNTHGATVYTIGIFSGADANSAGTEPSGNLPDGHRLIPAASNWFMQNLSSNNGKVQTPSYYLSASDADTLNNIFKKISDQSTTGGATTTLGESAVIKDIVTPYFQIDKKGEVYNVTAYSVASNDSFDAWDLDNKETVNGVTVQDNTVSVTGFNFAANWCGDETTNGVTTFHNGRKLVIEIVIKPSPGFLGGNGVITNGEASGVYDGNNKVGGLPQPDADVTIPDVEIGLKDNYTYLGAYMGNTVKEAELINETTIKYKYGEREFTIKKVNDKWVPEAEWMDAYVTIDVKLEYIGADDEYVTINGNIDGLYKDSKYKVTVTITPKYEDGEQSPKIKDSVTPINVFKPEVTYKDSEINLGDTANYEDKSKPNCNFVDVVWKHGTDEDKDIKEAGIANIFGSAPALTYEYSPEADKFTRDTPVKVAVSIKNSGNTPVDVTEHVKFYREECDYSTECPNVKVAVTSTDENRVNFIVHVKSFDLTITKKITKGEENQSFLFKITGPDGFSMEVVIADVVKESDKTKSVTIKNLPAGEYTVTEETSWSWRYTPDGSAERKITAANVINGEANVTFTNKLENTKWIDGNTYCKNKWNGNEIERTPQKN